MPEKADSPARRNEDRPQSLFPVEVEVYIDPDGSVTFADLEASLVPIAETLGSPVDGDQEAAVDD